MNFFIDNSDERNIFLMNMLKEKKYNVHTLDDISKSSTGDIFIFSPAKKIDESDIIVVPNNSIIFCGNLSEDLKEKFKYKNFIYHNYMHDEIFAIKNANLTAEAVLAIAISSTPKSIFSNNILIFGAGRISKALALLFNKLGVKYSICNYHKQNYENAFIFTNNCLLADEYKTIAKDFDVVINTIPSVHLCREDALLFSKGTIYIETASVASVQNNDVFSILQAPALPKKYSPVSAAKIMEEYILKEI